MIDTPDHQLIAQAQQGDADAVAALYQRYVDKMTRYVGYRMGDDVAAEDVIADIFVKMLEGLPNYKYTGAPFEAWLYRIARARVADYYRQQHRQPQEELPETLESADPPVEWNIQNAEEVAALRTALQQLSEEHQTILILRFIERKSHEEVAQLLDKNVSAVTTAQHRALKQLATLLGTTKDSRHYMRGETS